MKVLIISGGNSSERRISLMSSKQVKTALKKSNHQVKIFDLKTGLDKLKLEANKHHVLFPVLHGEEGEGGELQKFLSSLKIPFIGGHHKGYKKGWYKISFKKYCEENQIPTADWQEVDTDEHIINFGFPAVLKSDNGGSSREVVILKSNSDLSKYQTKKLLKSRLKLMIERFLPGIEVTAGVLHNNALPVVEIIPPEGTWFDYKNKYWGKTQEIPHAPSLTETQRKMVQNLALKIHNDLNLGSISRTDFMIHNGKPYALEVNTIPGMTSGSLLPKAAQAAGISFEQLVDNLVTMAHS